MLKQNLKLKLSQKLSPQQIQLMKLIQLSTLDLEQKIQNEIGENPALEKGIENQNAENNEINYENLENKDSKEIEIDEYINNEEMPYYKFHSNNYSGEDEKSINISGEMSIHQNLLQQMGNLILDEKESKISEFLVGSIDDSGYIRRTNEEIIDDIAFTQNIIVTDNELNKVLKLIQTLDPPGIGARSLKECLIIQLKKKKNLKSETLLAKKILDKEFDLFSKKNFSKLQEKFKISQTELKEAIEVISKLNPKPGISSSSISTANQIIPDFILTIEEGNIQISLNNRNFPNLKISNSYKEMLKGYVNNKNKTKSDNDAILFIKQKLDSAQWFINAIEQRYQTLSLTINAIVDYQNEYFLTGDERKLKPMILKDIAEKINMDISTISRVANSKYIETPYGIKLLKTFFSEGFKNQDGENISSIEIKNILESIIKKENKSNPITDEEISKLLKEKGYNVARRTVAKYREQLEIPMSRMRKEL
ncbi:MAG: RNA polymerase sigma-54 factor [Flavobacteriaceae bacterium]|nr:RNA polymerase sigma-54 factor [Flavobacteriaceae bacterium]|tara:strand:- start:5968 stop:7407 length:1440 start_codon:yes stop_codon:yes gene_type:complete